MKYLARVLSLVLFSVAFADGKLRSSSGFLEKFETKSNVRPTLGDENEETVVIVQQNRRLQFDSIFDSVIDFGWGLVEGFVTDIGQTLLCNDFIPGFVQETFFQCPVDSPLPSMSPQPSLTPSIAPSENALWDQVGGNVVGSTPTTSLGISVSLDAMGVVMVATGDNTVQVYHIFYNEDKIRNWELEKDLSLSVDGPRITCSLSYDTNSLAVGDPESPTSAEGVVVIFSNDPNGDAGWAEVVRVVGNSDGDMFGHSISMSNDGVRTAAAAPGQYVRIFDLRPNSYWFLEVVGTPDPQYFGQAVAISGDGNLMAVGEYGDVSNTGFVKLYELTSFGIIQTLLGTDNGDTFGHAVGMSNDGKVIAVGTKDKDYVKVYRETSSNKYEQVGGDVTVTDGAGSKFGCSVSVSYDGLRMVVGAPDFDANGAVETGATYVFSIGGGEVNLIAAFMGETAGDKTGSAVSIAGDGKRVAAGTVTNTGGKGAVRAFGKYNN